MLKFISHSSCINFCFRLLELDGGLSFKIRNSWKILRLLSEATQVLSIVNHHSHERDKIDSDLDAQGLLFSCIVKVVAVLVECSATQDFKMAEDFIHSLLGFFALCHL